MSDKAEVGRHRTVVGGGVCLVAGRRTRVLGGYHSAHIVRLNRHSDDSSRVGRTGFSAAAVPAARTAVSVVLTVWGVVVMTLLSTTSLRLTTAA